MTVLLLDGVTGFLRKNHNGQAFGKGNRRYFKAVGFTVYYYLDGTKSKLKGHFDLRNVAGVYLSSDPDVGEGSVELLIWDSAGRPAGADGVQKTMIISFSPAIQQREDWLRYWCSAVDIKYIDPALRQFRDPALSSKLDSEFGDTPAVSPRRSMFSSRAPSAKVILTPRTKDSAAAALMAQYGDVPSTPRDEELDTPRNRPPGGGFSAAPPLPAPPIPKPEGLPPPPPAKPPPVADKEEEEITFEITVRAHDPLQHVRPHQPPPRPQL